MDYKTLNDRLLEKGARADCAMCGENDWRGLGEGDEAELVAVPTPVPGGGYAAGYGHGAYGWACNNCGFVRLHAVIVLAPEEMQGPH